MKRGKSMSETVAPGRCKAFNRRGEPCSSPTVGRDGFCAAHSGKLDMKALGSKGGKGRTRAIVRDRRFEKSFERQQTKFGCRPWRLISERRFSTSASLRLSPSTRSFEFRSQFDDGGAPRCRFRRRLEAVSVLSAGPLRRRLTSAASPDEAAAGGAAGSVGYPWISYPGI